MTSNSSVARAGTLRERRFAEVFAAARKIDFNPAWSNGTGYFDFAVTSPRRESPHAPVLAHGEVVASTAPNGRRLLIIGTYFGSLVIFDRYSDGSGVFVVNFDLRLREAGWIDSGAQSDEDILFLLGVSGTEGIRGGIADVVRDVVKEASRILRSGVVA